MALPGTVNIPGLAPPFIGETIRFRRNAKDAMAKRLVADIGGTRIRATVLPERCSLKVLAEARIRAIRSIGWLNGTLPFVLSPDHWASIARDLGPFDSIALGIPGTVDGNGRLDGWLVRQRGVPADFRSQVERMWSRPVRLMNDAVAWGCGTAEVLRLCSLPDPLPSCCLVLGTGIGLSMRLADGTVRPIEIGDCPNPMRCLAEACGQDLREAWRAHHVVGRPFFDWVQDARPSWDYDEVRRQFTLRVAALFRDILPWLRGQVGSIRQVVVGGGNAEILSVRGLEERIGMPVIALRWGVIPFDPDLVPLAGLAASGSL